MKISMLRNLIMLSLLASSASGCATIVNSERQQVFIRGGAEEGVTKVRTPDGTFEVENGSGAFMMTRSKSDIPVKIVCPGGSSKNAIIETHYDWGWGGAGNILTYGIGFLVDPFSKNAYVINDFTLVGICDKVAH